MFILGFTDWPGGGQTKLYNLSGFCSEMKDPLQFRSDLFVLLVQFIHSVDSDIKTNSKRYFLGGNRTPSKFQQLTTAMHHLEV